MQEREYACNFNPRCDEIGNLRRKALFIQGQQSSWISHSNEVLEVKQCAYLSSAPSQVSQHSPKLCQCRLWDDQRISRLGHPFPRGTGEDLSCSVLRDLHVSHCRVHYTAQRPQKSFAPSPTPPWGALRLIDALCPTAKTSASLGHFGHPRRAFWKWSWHIQFSLPFSSLAQPLPRWQSSLCRDQLPEESAGHSLHSQK